MNSLKNILVGIDFSESSEAALAQAMRIARWNEAKVHIVHVVESLVISELAKAYNKSEAQTKSEVEMTARRHAEEAVAAAQARSAVEAGSKPMQLTVNVEIIVGNPFYEIMCRVRDLAAELLVVGAHGSSPSRDVAGTLATKLVRKVPTRVMLVRDKNTRPFKRIAACVDFSDSSPLVLEQAIRCAQQDGATIDVLHAFKPPWNVVHYMSPTPEVSADFQKQYRDQLRAQMKELMQPFESEITELTVEYNLHEAMDVKWGVSEYLKSSEANLAIIGTRGRTWLMKMLIGTTAEAVVRDSPCSVLALKPTGFTYEIG